MRGSYLDLSKGELEERVKKAWEILNPCRVCPRKCKVNRLKVKGKKEKVGFCGIGAEPVVISVHPHFGEESVLVGTGGSGTIFFYSCNLSCVYCQNWEISQGIKKGRSFLRKDRPCESVEELALMMLSLQKQGCHNINLVSPTIWAPQILKALVIARKKGLKLPLVYNTGGYDSVKTLKLLDGIIDIYMPDMKYSDSKIAKKYSMVENYWEVNQKAVREMFRQTGDLQFVENARPKGSAFRQVSDLNFVKVRPWNTLRSDLIASKGLLVRHLALPNNLAGTRKVMKFLASLSKDTYVNIMDQYRPCHKADQYPQLNRPITTEEYQKAIKIAKKAGLHRFDMYKPRPFWL